MYDDALDRHRLLYIRISRPEFHIALHAQLHTIIMSDRRSLSADPEPEFFLSIASFPDSRTRLPSAGLSPRLG